MPVRGFAGNQRALALEVWKRQLTDREAAYVFDLLGPARTQSYLPAPLRAPYLIPLYGIEVWRPLDGTAGGRSPRPPWCFAISAHTLERARPFAPGLGGARRPPPGPGGAQAGRGGRRRSSSAASAAGFFLIVGRMDARERYKGHDQLLEALRGIPDARLVVAGDGDDRAPAGGEGGGARDGRPRRLHRLHQRGDARRALPALRRVRDAEPGGGVRARLPGGDAGRQAGARRPRQRRRGDRGRRRDRPAGRSGRPRRAPGRPRPPARSPRRGPADGRGGVRALAPGVRRSSGSGSGWRRCWRGWSS